MCSHCGFLEQTLSIPSSSSWCSGYPPGCVCAPWTWLVFVVVAVPLCSERVVHWGVYFCFKVVPEPGSFLRSRVLLSSGFVGSRAKCGYRLSFCEGPVTDEIMVVWPRERAIPW